MHLPLSHDPLMQSLSPEHDSPSFLTSPISPQALLASPGTPTYPVRQAPQVLAVRLQTSRFLPNTQSLGADEQSTELMVLRTLLTVANSSAGLNLDKAPFIRLMEASKVDGPSVPTPDDDRPLALSSLVAWPRRRDGGGP